MIDYKARNKSLQSQINMVKATNKRLNDEVSRLVNTMLKFEREVEEYEELKRAIKTVVDSTKTELHDEED